LPGEEVSLGESMGKGLPCRLGLLDESGAGGNSDLGGGIGVFFGPLPMTSLSDSMRT